MDDAVSGFIRGQGSLCLILGIYYAVGLSIVGLNFGLLIGFVAGMISFIPYIGSLVGLILAVGVRSCSSGPIMAGSLPPWRCSSPASSSRAIFFSRSWWAPAWVLHPVWLMFALLAFGAMFGFVGLLIAVPAAAVVGVLVRFALTRYLQSDIYFGHSAALPWDDKAENRNQGHARAPNFA